MAENRAALGIHDVLPFAERQLSVSSTLRVGSARRRHPASAVRVRVAQPCTQPVKAAQPTAAMTDIRFPQAPLNSAHQFWYSKVPQGRPQTSPRQGRDFVRQHASPHVRPVESSSSALSHRAALLPSPAVLQWSAEEVAASLISLGDEFAPLADALVANRVNGTFVPKLDATSLPTMGIRSFDQILKLSSHFRSLLTQLAPLVSEPRPSEVRRWHEQERKAAVCVQACSRRRIVRMRIQQANREMAEREAAAVSIQSFTRGAKVMSTCATFQPARTPARTLAAPALSFPSPADTLSAGRRGKETLVCTCARKRRTWCRRCSWPRLPTLWS